MPLSLEYSFHGKIYPFTFQPATPYFITICRLLIVMYNAMVAMGHHPRLPLSLYAGAHIVIIHTCPTDKHLHMRFLSNSITLGIPHLSDFHPPMQAIPRDIKAKSHPSPLIEIFKLILTNAAVPDIDPNFNVKPAIRPLDH